jgi:hypothetical protein
VQFGWRRIEGFCTQGRPSLLVRGGGGIAKTDEDDNAKCTANSLSVPSLNALVPFVHVFSLSPGKSVAPWRIFLAWQRAPCRREKSSWPPVHPYYPITGHNRTTGIFS